MFENSTPFALNLVVAWLVARRAGSVPSESPERLDDGRLRWPECATVKTPSTGSVATA